MSPSCRPLVTASVSRQSGHLFESEIATGPLLLDVVPDLRDPDATFHG